MPRSGPHLIASSRLARQVRSAAPLSRNRSAAPLRVHASSVSFRRAHCSGRASQARTSNDTSPSAPRLAGPASEEEPQFQRRQELEPNVKGAHVVPSKFPDNVPVLRRLIRALRAPRRSRVEDRRREAETEVLNQLLLQHDPAHGPEAEPMRSRETYTIAGIQRRRSVGQVQLGALLRVSNPGSDESGDFHGRSGVEVPTTTERNRSTHRPPSGLVRCREFRGRRRGGIAPAREPFRARQQPHPR